MADEEATFSLKLDSNAAKTAREDRDALEQLRATVNGAQDNLKALSAAQRSLRGSTTEVANARKQLKAQIEIERNAISRANLELLKAGTTYTKVAGEAKKLADETKGVGKEKLEGLRKTVEGIGGPVAEGVRGFDLLSATIGKAGLAATLGVGIFAGLLTAIVAVTAAAIAGTIAFAKWAFGAANAARDMQLVREAATATAQDAKNLGTQVDALAAKVATPKKELNDLATQLARTRLSGQAIVDTFNLVGQASAAMGDDVGRTLQEITTRGQRTQRFSLNAPELQGTKIKFQDVAGELAKNLHVGIADAQQALIEGRVKLDDGAKALRQAVEKRFAEINARKLLSLTVVFEKLEENLSALARDIHLEPLVQSIGKFFSYFTDSTVAGSALHEIVTVLGNGMVDAITKSMPLAKAFLKGLVIGALDVTIALLKVRGAFLRAFPDDGPSKASALSTALSLALGPLEALAKVLEAIGKGLEIATKLTGGNVGAALGAGLEGGMRGMFPAVAAAAEGLGAIAKNSLAGTLEVHSPSKVGERIGKGLDAGVEKGIEAGRGDVAAASVGMAAAAGGGASAGASGGGGGGITIGSIQITIPAAAKDTPMAQQVSSPGFVAALTKAIEDACTGAGVAVQTTVTP